MSTRLTLECRSFDPEVTCDGSLVVKNFFIGWSLHFAGDIMSQCSFSFSFSSSSSPSSSSSSSLITDNLLTNMSHSLYRPVHGSATFANETGAQSRCLLHVSARNHQYRFLSDAFLDAARRGVYFYPESFSCWSVLPSLLHPSHLGLRELTFFPSRTLERSRL